MIPGDEIQPEIIPPDHKYIMNNIEKYPDYFRMLEIKTTDLLELESPE